jgi:coproporphyrinogen III oxidase-like Fe-S oxidoreductase
LHSSDLPPPLADSGGTRVARLFAGRFLQVAVEAHADVAQEQAATGGDLDPVRRDAITRVMCDLELDFAAFGKEWNVAFTDYFADALSSLRPLADDGLVNIETGKISVTPTGRLFLRNIGMCFDRYLKETSSDKPRYSRTA